VVVGLCLEQRTLREVDAVELVIGALVNGVAWRAHRLLSHLALVHVTRRLVELREGCHVRNDTHERVGIQLLVCGLAFGKLLWLDHNVQIALFHGADVFCVTGGQIFDRSYLS